jgi:YidC/Oxa1 family membrane protein insertase
MQQWARFAILGAMFVTAYLLILAWQKDYGHAQRNQQRLLLLNHMKYLQICQMLKIQHLQICHKQICDATSYRCTASVNQQLISVQTDLYHLWINPKGGDIVRIELLSMIKQRQ